MNRISALMMTWLIEDLSTAIAALADQNAPHRDEVATALIGKVRNRLLRAALADVEVDTDQPSLPIVTPIETLRAA